MKKWIPNAARKLLRSAFLPTAFLAAFLLFTPMCAKAAWAPQPLPAESFDTTFGDARYVNPDLWNKKVTISYQGKNWVTGMSAFQNMPIRLTTQNGQLIYHFTDTAVFDGFFKAIDVELGALTAQANAPIFMNDAGSYIIQNGNLHMATNPAMHQWLANTLEVLLITGKCNDVNLELTAEYLVPVSDSQDLSISPDFVKAGTCTTSYTTSSANRCTNISVAASRLNNLVVLPGQTASVSDTILPRTAANGYKAAGVYLNGVHTTGMGGGVCQVSSTVYNAVMNAGLTVVERKPHSMPVSYLPKGLDAAIAAGSKDLKFRNDYAAPVILQTSINKKKLTVSVLVLNSELNGRSFKLWAKQTGSLSATSYLTTYVNGVETGTVKVANSKYNPYRESGE